MRVLLASVLLCLSVTGCGGDEEEPGASGSSAPTTANASPDPDAFWAIVREDESAALVGREDAVALGEQICEATGSAGTMDRGAAIDAGIDSGFSPVEAAHMVDAAQEHLCPGSG